MAGDLFAVLHGLGLAMTRLGERSGEIDAALSDAERAALTADVEEMLGLFQAIVPRVGELRARIEGRAAAALGPNWMETPARGGTASADQRSYAHRDERRR